MAQNSDAQPDSSASKAFRPWATWPTWLGRACALLVLATACVAVYHLARRQPAPVEERLYIDQKYLDFGEVWENPKFDWVLPIENRSEEDVEIKDFNSTCSCLAIEPRHLTVAAKQRAHVRITLDLTYRAPSVGKRKPGYEGSGFKHAEADKATRGFAADVIPQLSRGSVRPSNWVIRGRVRSAFDISSRVVDFGAKLRGKPFETRAVHLIAYTKLKEVILDCDLAHVTAHVTKVDQEGKEYKITVHPKQSVPTGHYQRDIQVVAVTLEGKRSSASFRIQGELVGNFYAVPESVILGSRSVGETIKETLVLRSQSGTRVECMSFVSPDDLIIESPTSLRASDCRFYLSQRISGVGAYTACIRFTVRGEGVEAPEEVVVRVTYHGVPHNDPTVPSRKDDNASS